MTELRRYRSVVMDSGRWEGFGFREDDVVINTPAKCGTTWMQMLCAMLILDTVELPRPLAELSPWLDMRTTPLAEVLALLEAQEHRRFIKTHTPPDGLVMQGHVTYLFVGRDPRDVALSWDNHAANMDPETLYAAISETGDVEGLPTGPPMALPEDPVERFWLWADTEDDSFPGPPLASIVDHLHQAWALREAPNVFLFHYADLSADLPGEIRRLAGVLGAEVAEDRVATFAEAARFDSMKRRADLLAPDVGHRIWRSNSNFFHKGESGRWRSLLDEAGLRRYDERVAALVDDPGFVTWLHAGSLGTDLHAS